MADTLIVESYIHQPGRTFLAFSRDGKYVEPEYTTLLDFVSWAFAGSFILVVSTVMYAFGTHHEERTRNLEQPLTLKNLSPRSALQYVNMCTQLLLRD